MKNDIKQQIKINIGHILQRLHVIIAKGYKDEYIFDDSQLKVCIFVVNQEQASEVVFRMKINCG
jgi:hypothetical protein